MSNPHVIQLLGHTYKTEIITAQGKKGEESISITHQVLFAVLTQASSFAERVRSHGYINTDYWIYKGSNSSFIPQLRADCVARYKTQLYSQPSF